MSPVILDGLEETQELEEVAGRVLEPFRLFADARSSREEFRRRKRAKSAIPSHGSSRRGPWGEFSAADGRLGAAGDEGQLIRPLPGQDLRPIPPGEPGELGVIEVVGGSRGFLRGGRDRGFSPRPLGLQLGGGHERDEGKGRVKPGRSSWRCSEWKNT